MGVPIGRRGHPKPSCSSTLRLPRKPHCSHRVAPGASVIPLAHNFHRVRSKTTWSSGPLHNVRWPIPGGQEVAVRIPPARLRISRSDPWPGWPSTRKFPGAVTVGRNPSVAEREPARRRCFAKSAAGTSTRRSGTLEAPKRRLLACTLCRGGWALHGRGAHPSLLDRDVLSGKEVPRERLSRRCRRWWG